MSDTMRVFVYALYTALATGLGALPFLFVRDLSRRVVAASNAIAAGLMLGASLGLVAEGAQRNGWATFVGVNVGIGFIVLTQRLIGDHEPEIGQFRGAGARRMLLMVVVMTVHSFAEGAAVGVSFGGGMALATAITVAIAVHNVPEGLAISAVLRPQGVSLLACAAWSVFSSLPQPLMAVPAYLFVERVASALPYGLGFAAGAMIFMVLVELLPEAYEQERGRRVALLTGLTLAAMLLFQQYV
ncbi:zinc/iron permease [Gemmatirosa kalamazoonensis]|uniref:Zinc/iron permease n=1 Tax=Gemmatirosa kalamazoonensis TaxID=861299 RepID=W0REI4_9BACT|nr:ZIP family metal transporter [Gemmatirosa kalamazoonensis]AHG89524.1 zinc/iron permease [Gemmatirosa kalamazoonensis]